VSYTTAQLTMMMSVKAEVTISEGATISPDPSAALDYTKPQSFTVTAPDGVTTRTYTTRPVEKVLETYVKVSEFFEKTATELSTTATTIGISGTNLVIGTNVFNAQTMASVGTLNTTGLEGKAVAWLGNDEAGHLVGAFTADGGIESSPATIAVWREGWDNAPHIQAKDSGATWGRFLSVSGNVVEGQGIITAQGASQGNGPNHFLTLTDGTHAYTQILTGLPSNDGSWGQQLSAASGDPTGAWFCWDSAPGTTNIYTGNDWKAGEAPVIRPLTGSGINGANLWGNYTRGTIKAFTFDETPMCLTMTTGWPCTYVAIVDQENNFILNSADATLNIPADYIPVGTYIYNEADGCGYIYVLIPGNILKSWKVEIAYL
jgi:hypothetical protein